MGLGSDRTSSSRTPMGLMAIVIVLVALTIVLAPLSVYFYWQEQDYRGAKYRSQALLVSTCIGSVNGVIQEIPGMYDDSSPITNRSWSAEHAHECLWDLVEASRAIAYMYLTGSEENDTFAALEDAAELMTIAIKGVSKDMWNNVTLSSPYLENVTIRTNSLLTVPNFVVIGRLLMNATDPERDFAKSPYSLVNRMDLDAIKTSSEGIIQLATPLQPHR